METTWKRHGLFCRHVCHVDVRCFPRVCSLREDCVVVELHSLPLCARCVSNKPHVEFTFAGGSLRISQRMSFSSGLIHLQWLRLFEHISTFCPKRTKEMIDSCRIEIAARPFPPTQTETQSKDINVDSCFVFLGGGEIAADFITTGLHCELTSFQLPHCRGPNGGDWKNHHGGMTRFHHCWDNFHSSTFWL